MLFRFATAGLLLVCSANLPRLNASHAVNKACREDPRVIAACFGLHGRLSNWNGNPTRRVWIIGTKRMLGLREGTSLPAAVESKLGDFDDEIYGDFEFCP